MWSRLEISRQKFCRAFAKGRKFRFCKLKPHLHYIYTKFWYGSDKNGSFCLEFTFYRSQKITFFRFSTGAKFRNVLFAYVLKAKRWSKATKALPNCIHLAEGQARVKSLFGTDETWYGEVIYTAKLPYRKLRVVYVNGALSCCRAKYATGYLINVYG